MGIIIKIADLNIQFNCLYNYTPMLCKDYIIEQCNPDFTVTVSKNDIISEKKNLTDNFSDGYIESICAYRKLAEWLPSVDAFVMHSALFDVNGSGVAFAALSGTGKTTHMLLWKKLLGEHLTIINGDKPIIRFLDKKNQFSILNNSLDNKKPFAFGTPWNGKENLGDNLSTELKHICFIKRNKENFVETIEPDKAIDFIMQQVFLPKNPIYMIKTMEMINKLLYSCKLWIINCNMDPTSADIAYKTIFNK